MKTPLSLLLAAALALPAAALAKSPWRNTIHFEISTNAGMGNSMFVVGSHPDIGFEITTNSAGEREPIWNVLKAVPLAWHSNNVWSADVGIQAGTELEYDLEYKFIKRSTAADQISDPGNLEWEGGGNHKISVHAEPAFPGPGKRVVFLCDWPEPVEFWYSTLDSSDFDSTNDWQVATMTKTGDARFEIDGVGKPGEWMRFTFRQATSNWWYHFRPTDEKETDFWSPLDALCVRDAQVFNYEPEVPLSTPVAASRIEKVFVNSQADGVDGREISIYLPRGYDQNLSRRYPVIYFADGQNIFSEPGAAMGGWKVDTAANQAIRAGHMREAILVGVPCRETPPPNYPDKYAWAGRLWEYLPGTDTLMGTQLNGNGFNYMKFLLDNVRPTLDWNYRTLTDRANTGHAGSSAGGLLSYWLGTYTNVFGLIGAVSGVYNEEYIPAFRNWCFSHVSDIGPNAIKRIWLDTGTEETAVGDDDMKLNLYDSNWDALTLLLYGGHVQNKSLHFGVYHSSWDGDGNYDNAGEHNEIAWAARAPDILRFLLPVTDDFNPLLPRELSLDGNSISFPVYAGDRPQIERLTDLVRPAPERVWPTTDPATEDRPWTTRTFTPSPSGFYRLRAD